MNHLGKTHLTSLSLLLVLILNSGCSKQYEQKENLPLDPDAVLMKMSDRIYNVLQDQSEVKLPRNVEEGKVRFTSSSSWTSGFFPGMLWMLKDVDADRDWLTYAERHTQALEELQYDSSHHDLGFMLYGSYGKGFNDNQNEAYKKVLLTGTKSLASRYDDQIGMIKSWDRPGKWQYPVIIDNMMNLEYLFWATKVSGDSSYYDMALSHANRTMRDHYRPDNSTYHVVDYDTITGESIWKGTHQGLADESVWSRGQAWGLYGFTMAYRETGEQVFLDHALRIATFLLDHPAMPEDYILYWDLKDPKIPDAPRDVSAAAITASALIELSGYVLSEQANFLNVAEKILTNLENDYRYMPTDQASYFYLDKSVGNMPKGKEVSIPIIYAEYYFMEALIRLKEAKS